MLTVLPVLAASTDLLATWGPWLLMVLQVALGLGFIIFVHELGHFAVAKWCGVRCDKFMIGFDIGGYKLSKKVGETEYGIGVLPLGGYVKMYGQEDNVASIAEELERSKALEGSPDAKEVMGPNGEKYWIDRRSYMAKSVPQRMAIISAGVIMNIIFAFIFAWIAYGIGVPETQCVAGPTAVGGPAWQAGIMPGDRLVKINDIENPSYKQLQESVLLGDKEKGLACEIKQANGTMESILLKADTSGSIPMVGIAPSQTLRLALKNPTAPFAPAGQLPEGEGFAPGDQITAINGETITTFQQLIGQLIEHKSEAVTYTVIRGGKTKPSEPFAPITEGETVEVTVPVNPMERLGIVATLGQIVAIQAGSPAEAAGFKKEDQILTINGIAIGAAEEGQESWDPITLGDHLAPIAVEGGEVVVTLRRGTQTLELAVQPRVVTWSNMYGVNSPLAIESLGLACELRAEVGAIVEGSPAAASDLKPGDKIVAVKFSSENKADGASPKDPPIVCGDKHRAWPLVMGIIQDHSSDFKVELTFVRDEKKQVVTLTPASVADAYSRQRGTAMMPLKQLDVVTEPGPRLKRAWDETTHALMSVFRFLGKIGSDIPATALGGPITIAQVAGNAANDGYGALLMIMTMISANLAVINFLPIPVLDGGHMVFLLWEGITGRPANEKVMIALHMIGFALLLSLMLFVFGLDLGLIPRGL